MRPPSRWLLGSAWIVCAVIWLQHLFTIGVCYYVKPWTFRDQDRQLAVLVVLGPCILATCSVFFSRTCSLAIAWVLGVLLVMGLIGSVPPWKGWEALQLGPDTEELPRSTLMGTQIGLCITLLIHYPLSMITAIYTFFVIQLRLIVDRKVIRSRVTDTTQPPSQ